MRRVEAWIGVAFLAAALPSRGAPGPRAEVVERSGGRLSCRPASPAEAVRARAGAASVHILARSRESLAASAGLHIVLRGTDQLETNSRAKAGFLAAASRWESLISSPVTIVIDVDYGKTAFGTPFTSDVIAGFTSTKGAQAAWSATRAALQNNSAGKVGLYRSLPTGAIPTDVGPVNQIQTSAAVFRALGLLAAVEGPAAEKAALGDPSRIAFQDFPDIDFDPSDGIAVNGEDFDFLATHEIGHVLGFDSWVGVKELFPNDPPVVAMLDLYRFRPSRENPDLSATPRVLTPGGEQVFFFSGPQLSLSTAGGTDFPAGDFSASHWKSQIFTGRLGGIMEPLDYPGIRNVVTSRDLAVLDAIGWRIAGPAPAELSVRTIPIILDAAGVGGVRFSTELTLANRSMAPADVELAYTPATFLGASGGGTATTTLAAFSQALIPDALGWLRDHGVPVPASGNQGGTLKITFRGDTSPDSFYAGARTTSPAGGGRAGLAYAAIRAFDGLEGRSYVFGLRENAADRSNLALVNMSSAPVTLRVTLRPGSGDGRSAALPDVTLEAGQWTQLSRVLAGAGYTNGWATIDLVSGKGPYAAYAVFNDNATNDGSYVSAVADPLLAEPQLVPVVVETPTFSSELILTNPSGAAVTASLSYVESLSPSAGPGGAATLSLAPGEQRIIASAVDWLRTHGSTVGPKGGSFAGTVTAAFSSGGGPAFALAGARTSASGDGGAYGLFTPAVGLSRGFLWDTWVFGLKQDAATRSNLAVINTGLGSEPLTLHVEVFDGAAGALSGRTPSFTLAPGGWTQFGGILVSFGVANGYARIVYESGSGSFLAYGVLNDGASPSSGGTNDGSYVAASKR